MLCVGVVVGGVAYLGRRNLLAFTLFKALTFEGCPSESFKKGTKFKQQKFHTSRRIVVGSSEVIYLVENKSGSSRIACPGVAAVEGRQLQLAGVRPGGSVAQR